MRAVSLALVPLLLCTSPAFADIEQIATTCDSGICLYWWPALPSVAGWHHDREQSLSFGVNAQAPDGYTFENAETVIYAKALYKPKEPEIASVAELIQEDAKRFLAISPDIQITEVEPLRTADGQLLRSFTFFPRGQGNWEQVSYGEEDDFFLMFAVSSTSHEGLMRTLSDYSRFVSGYQKRP